MFLTSSISDVTSTDAYINYVMDFTVDRGEIESWWPGNMLYKFYEHYKGSFVVGVVVPEVTPRRRKSRQVVTVWTVLPKVSKKWHAGSRCLQCGICEVKRFLIATIETTSCCGRINTLTISTILLRTFAVSETCTIFFKSPVKFRWKWTIEREIKDTYAAVIRDKSAAIFC